MFHTQINTREEISLASQVPTEGLGCGVLGVLTHPFCSRVFRDTFVVLWCRWSLRVVKIGGCWGLRGAESTPQCWWISKESLECWCNPQGRVCSSLPPAIPSQWALTLPHSPRGSKAEIGSSQNPVSPAAAGTIPRFCCPLSAFGTGLGW